MNPGEGASHLLGELSLEAEKNGQCEWLVSQAQVAGGKSCIWNLEDGQRNEVKNGDEGVTRWEGENSADSVISETEKNASFQCLRPQGC